MDLNHKVAIVTGATKGIGKAVALGLAQMNYRLAIIGRNEAELEQVANEIKKISGLVPLSFQLDITNTVAPHAFAGRLHKRNNY